MKLFQKVSLFLTKLTGKKKLTNDKRQEYIDMSQQGSSLAVLPKFARADKEIVLRSMTKNSSIEQLQFAHKAFQSDWDIAKKAIISNPNNIRHISNALKDNDDFILDVSADPHSIIDLEAISSRLSRNPEFILKLLQLKKDFPQPHIYLHDDLVNNIEFMREAVNYSPYVYHYVNVKTIKDFKLATTVFSNPQFAQYNNALTSFYHNFYADNQIFNLTVLKHNENLFGLMTESMKNDYDICLLMVQTYDLSKSITQKPEYKYNKSLISKYISENPKEHPKIYKDIDISLQSEPRIALLTLLLDETMFQYLPEKLSKNVAFLKLAYKENPYIIKHLAENPYKDSFLKDRSFVEMSIPLLSDYPHLMPIAGQYFMHDESWIHQCLTENPSCYEYLSGSFRDNLENILLSIGINSLQNIRYYPDTFFTNTQNVAAMLEKMNSCAYFEKSDDYNEKHKFLLVRLAHKIFLNNNDYAQAFENMGFTNFMDLQSNPDFDILKLFNDLIEQRKNS